MKQPAVAASGLIGRNRIKTSQNTMNMERYRSTIREQAQTNSNILAFTSIVKVAL
jgi:hypothetical protein